MLVIYQYLSTFLSNENVTLSHSRCKQLQETAHQLEYRNSSLEQKFSDLTQKLLQSQAREVELRDQLASSLPQGEKTSLEDRIEGLKKKEAELRLQNSLLQEVAEVSRQQVVAMETKRKSHDLELSSLRHQLLDVQMQSDEKSLIGRLHHQIVALQVHVQHACSMWEWTCTCRLSVHYTIIIYVIPNIQH